MQHCRILLGQLLLMLLLSRVKHAQTTLQLIISPVNTCIIARVAKGNTRWTLLQRNDGFLPATTQLRVFHSEFGDRHCNVLAPSWNVYCVVLFWRSSTNNDWRLCNLANYFNNPNAKRCLHVRGVHSLSQWCIFPRIPAKFINFPLFPPNLYLSPNVS